MNPQSSSAQPLSTLFGAPIPRGMRDRTTGMSWDAVLARFSHCPGPLRLGRWECTDAPRPAARLGAQPRNFKATLAIGDRICTASAAACGPVAALTAMLHDHGFAFETLSFHQLQAGDRTATFVHGRSGDRDEWAVGWSADTTESALRAIIACVNRTAEPGSGCR